LILRGDGGVSDETTTFSLRLTESQHAKLKFLANYFGEKKCPLAQRLLGAALAEAQAISDEVIYPEEGRLIRIKPTPVTEAMGIAGWEGYAQGTAPEYGLFFFYRLEQLPGDAKIAIPSRVEWSYVEAVA
jgi:hypothetical protein